MAADYFAELHSVPAIFPPSRKSGCTAAARTKSRIDREVERHSAERLTPAERRGATTADRALLIYTSGTTGLPKAANVSHHRLLQWSFWFAGLMNTGPDDRMYDCLPMYHSIGGVVATGALLVNGGSVVIRDKFSTQNFWQDICDWDCTLFQYIGELCRYLVNAPGNPRERAHRLRLVCGNGLNAEVWRTFQQQFRIPRILEFYAATEGNVSLYNVEGKIGAIGRVPSFLTHRFPLALVRYDDAAGEPARDADGFCIRCTADEVGEAIGRIGGGRAVQSGNGAFEGYTSENESRAKDLAQRVRARRRLVPHRRSHAQGCRTAFSISSTASATPFAGRAKTWRPRKSPRRSRRFPASPKRPCTASPCRELKVRPAWRHSLLDGALDFAALREHLARSLPSYARPLFLRIKDRIEVTATFKHHKHELKREGYDPEATTDAIYFDDPARQAFVRLDAERYRRIQAGAIRL